MPETVDITDLWQARPRKNDKRGNDSEDVFQNTSSDENNSTNTPILSESTYNLADHITPPVITPLVFSDTETSESTEGNETDVSKQIIPPYLFFMPSNTKSLNVEFNRCLLLDIETMPSTSSEAIRRENLRDAISAIQPASSSSSFESSSSGSSKSNKRVTFSRHENIEEKTKKPISIECDTKPECNSKALNIEFNRCLLLDIESTPPTSADINMPSTPASVNMPSTPASVNMPSTSADVNMPSTSADVNMQSTSSDCNRRKTLRHPVCVMSPVSTSSSSESLNLGCNRVTISLHGNIQEEGEESISTDCDMQTEYSSKTHPSSSIESSQSDEIIPENSINIEFQENPEISEECGEDSKATDADVLDMPDTYATLSATSLDVDEEIKNDLVENDSILQTERYNVDTQTNDVGADAEINNELVEDESIPQNERSDFDPEPNDDNNKSYNNSTGSATYKNEASQTSFL